MHISCSEMLRRWQVLDQLQNRNETLFYNVLVSNITEMAPIIYTPTVGWVCVNYHNIFQKPRGMYLCSLDRGEVAPLIYNWPSTDVDAIVITDGSRVLGLGDQGLNGIGVDPPLPFSDLLSRFSRGGCSYLWHPSIYHADGLCSWQVLLLRLCVSVNWPDCTTELLLRTNFTKIEH